jgi:hypothetical protein
VTASAIDGQPMFSLQGAVRRAQTGWMLAAAIRVMRMRRLGSAIGHAV